MTLQKLPAFDFDQAVPLVEDALEKTSAARIALAACLAEKDPPRDLLEACEVLLQWTYLDLRTAVIGLAAMARKDKNR